MPDIRKTIILVNDSQVQRNLLAGILCRAGLSVMSFGGAEEAMLAIQAGTQPDLIITDLYMPDIDGWRFCRLLRSPEYQACNRTPILVISATFSGEETERLTREIGADALLAMPQDLPHFLHTARALLHGSFQPTLPRVLLVEDGKSLVNVLKEAFEAHGYQADFAMTACQAVEMYETRVYDVAVIDYHLPDGQGDDLLVDFCRNRPDCVCIMMSSDPQQGLALECMKKGAAAYLRKPFTPEYVVEICARSRRERTLLRVEDRLEQRTQELRQSEERFQALFRQAPDPLFIWRKDDTLFDVNDRACRLLGYDREELLQLSLLDVQAPESRGRKGTIIKKELSQSVCEGFDLRKDGTIIPVEVVTVPITLRGEDFALSSSRDISRRKQAEKALQDSENRYRRQRKAIAELALDQTVISGDLTQAYSRLTEVTSATIQVARASIWMISESGTHLQCVSLFEAKSGSHSQGIEILLTDISQYFNTIVAENQIYAEDAQTDPRANELAEKYLTPLGITSMLDAGILIEGKLVGIVSLEHVGEKRRWHPDEQSFAGTMAAIAAHVLANSERNNALTALRRSEEQYRELFESAPVGIFRTHPAGRFLAVNPELAELAGYVDPSEMITQIMDIATQLYARPEERDILIDNLERCDHVINYELEWKRRDGKPFWVSLNIRKKQDPDAGIVYSGFLMDITERKRSEAERHKLESQLRHAHKMEAVGTLAGGIAHDFNNILQGISGYAQLLLGGKMESDPDFKGLKHIRKSCERAKALIRQMLAFSRKMEGDLRPMDLNQEVLDTHRILTQTLPRMLNIELDLDSALWPINADPVQIQQILLNLCSNAADAMPAGGELCIVTKNSVFAEETIKNIFDISPGKYVQLAVTDTGCGMDEQTRQKVFDPFFTTKEVGKGTGLGLASVYGIVKSLGGYILCYSVAGEGSTFKIYLPSLESGQIQAEADAAPTEQLHGSETIMVVDDDDAIQEVTAEALANYGYTVITASRGEEALAVHAQRKEEIDLVLLDLNMPGMGGHQCLQELLRRDPNTRVLIASGYTAHGHVREVLATGARGFIGKPYHLRDLAAKVREALMS